MKNLYLKISFLVIWTMTICQPNAFAQKLPQLGTDPVDEVIGAMTIQEKAAILTGTGMPGFNGITPVVGFVDKGRVPGAAGTTCAIPRLGIPSVVVADGPAGLRIQPQRPDDKNTYYATAFPVGTELACTWNVELVREVGEAMGNEVKEYGADAILAPALNIMRNPLCGRNFEYYSEDPVVAGKTAAAMVNGIQSNGVGTSIKHFAANNQETNRLSINEHISERAMREIYLRGFGIAVKNANPWTVMSSYNLINGTYTSAHKDLLSDILRDEWGFKGIVMTDWFGGYDGFGSISGGASSDVAAQLSAGNDLLMPGVGPQREAIVKAIKNGSLPEEVVDRDIKRILEFVMKSPTFKGYKYSNKPDLKLHARITRQAAAEGMVLLENKDHVLPFTDRSKPLALFGVTSYNFISGGTGSGDVNEAYTVSLMDGLKNAGYQPDKDLIDKYVPFTEMESKKEAERREKAGILSAPQRLPEMPLDAGLIEQKAGTSDIAVITIGRNAGEGNDRQVDGDFNLAGDEMQLMDQVSAAFHKAGKKVVVILNVGGVIETASWKDKVDGILLAWQPGQEGGNSVVDVFSGKVNPSGKLTMTFPVKYEDTPSAKNWLGLPEDDPRNVNYEEGIYVGYRYFSTFNVKTSYEFGYGLSYTTFGYSNLKISSPDFKDQIVASVDITNTGKTAGKEIVELYLSAPHKTIDKPAEELKDYVKTRLLKPGETQTVRFTITADELASFIENRHAWVAEAGDYQIRIGCSSLDIRQEASFSLAGEKVVEKDHDAFVQKKPVQELKFH